VSVDLVRDPFEARPDSPVVRAVSDAVEKVLTVNPQFVGENPWMDSALLSAAGIDTVVIGPHGAGAHAATEWVDLASVHQLGRILAEAAQQYCA
jgi:acetylornithine deacetylase